MPDNTNNGDDISPSRREYLAVLGMGAAAGLAGCTGTDSENTQEQLDEPVELYTWNLPFLEESINGWLDDFENEFSDTYENLETEWTDRGPETEAILSYFQSRLQGGDPPNIFDTQMTTFTRYAQEGETGIWAPLGDFADDEFLDTYYDRLIEVMTRDGQLLNMPFYMGTNATFSRNQWFEEADIEPPSIGDYPSTMEYLDMAEELVDNSGADFGLTFIRFDWNIWPWFESEGIDVLNDDESQVAFNTDRTHEILSRLRELTQNRVIPEVSWTGEWQPAAEQFGAGNTGMYFGSGSALRLIQNFGSDWVSEDTMNVGGAPQGDRYGGLLTMHGLGIVEPEHSEVAQEASFDLISVILNKKWQEDFLRNTTVLVPHQEAVQELQDDEEFSQENPTLVEIYDLWGDVNSNVWVPPLVSGSSEMAQIIDNQFSAAALGETPVDAAIEQAEQQCNQALE